MAGVNDGSTVYSFSFNIQESMQKQTVVWPLDKENQLSVPSPTGKHTVGSGCAKPLQTVTNFLSLANSEGGARGEQSSPYCKALQSEGRDNGSQMELREVRIRLINEQENALAWERECQRVTEQGKLLYSSYLARCNRLKHTITQLEQERSKTRELVLNFLFTVLCLGSSSTHLFVLFWQEQLYQATQQKQISEISEWKQKYLDLAGRFKQNFSFYKELEAVSLLVCLFSSVD